MSRTRGQEAASGAQAGRGLAFRILGVIPRVLPDWCRFGCRKDCLFCEFNNLLLFNLYVKVTFVLIALLVGLVLED